MEGLAVPFKTITTGITSIVEFFGDILSYLNPLDDNFILKNVVEFLSNILSYINPLSDNFILKDIISFFTELISYINPLSDNFFGKKIVNLFSDLLQYLFVPKEDHFSELKTTIDEKFGIVNQLSEVLNLLFNPATTYAETDEAAPTFDITYMGYTFSIIDFSIFAYFRTTVHTIIAFVLWAGYLIRLYKRLPGIIGGFDTSDVTLPGGAHL